MKETIRQQWVQALRSSEYTQARFNLRTNEGYCCLGVLCDLYVKETDNEWTVYRTETKDEIPYTYYRVDGESCVLPDCVVKWSGLDDQNPCINLHEDDKTTFADLNDEGKTFDQIAQLIEAQL